jgi:hypothetical protein
LKIAAVAVALLLAWPAQAQPVEEAALKAAFLYNFAKFTAWPADALPAGAPMNICVMGDGAIAGALKQIIAGRSIDGHDGHVVPIAADGPLRTCHILYVAGDDAHKEADILGSLKGAPVLTVGGTSRFTATGGVARLFVDGGRMRFAVNIDAALRARLHLSSKLLALGLVVKDDGDGAH